MKIISELSASCDISEIFSVKKVIKLLQKNLDGMKKSRTFALPLENGRLVRLRVLRKTGAEK